jgi:GGDEF domain-containing protein
VAADILIESPAPPWAVRAAIREDAREWRESVIPPTLRKELRYRVIARVKGDRFRMGLPSHSSEEDVERVALMGMVSAAPDSGSIVRATFRSGSPDWWTMVAGVGILVTFWSVGWGLALLAAAGIEASLEHRRDSRLSPETSATAAYLAERLQGAVMRAAPETD